MPDVSRWMIRMSLVYFLVSAGIGMCMLINKAHPYFPEVWLLLPVHIEFMIFGWVIQFTLGTAYWILPRFLDTKGRGNGKAAMAMPVLLNMGIVLVALSTSGTGFSYLALSGRILEALTVILFISLHWKRVVSYSES